MGVVRIILGVIVGVALGVGVVMAADTLNHQFFPPPPEVQVTNPESIRDWMARAPVLSLLWLPVTWTVAAFVAGFAAAKIAGRAWAGWIAGGLMFAATCLNLVMIPHPLWMLITALVFVPLAAWFSGKLGAPKAA